MLVCRSSDSTIVPVPGGDRSSNYVQCHERFCSRYDPGHVQFTLWKRAWLLTCRLAPSGAPGGVNCLVYSAVLNIIQILKLPVSVPCFSLTVGTKAKQFLTPG